MTRRCSHCSHNGHNSRTCPNRGVKLFGVRLTDGSIRKSASMGNLSLLAGSSGGASPADGPENGGAGGATADGYASDDFVQGSSSSCRERKKGYNYFLIYCFTIHKVINFTIYIYLVSLLLVWIFGRSVYFPSAFWPRERALCTLLLLLK